MTSTVGTLNINPSKLLYAHCLQSAPHLSWRSSGQAKLAAIKKSWELHIPLRPDLRKQLKQQQSGTWRDATQVRYDETVPAATKDRCGVAAPQHRTRRPASPRPCSAASSRWRRRSAASRCTAAALRVIALMVACA